MTDGEPHEDRRSGDRTGAHQGKEEQGRSGADRHGRETEGQTSEGGQGRREGGGPFQGAEPSTAEWVVGILCGLLVVAIVVYLARDALTGPTPPPVLEVRVEEVTPTTAGYVVEFTTRNTGGGTAANVMVEGTLMQDTTVVERSAATLDFVPAETQREGGLLFTRNPNAYRLEMRATGFDRP